MTAFFIATVTIKDPEKFQEYARQAGATFAAHGGEPVMRGRLDSMLTGGEAGHQTVGIVKFPDAAALSAWHASSAYQAIIPLRDEAADVTIASYVVPA